MMWAAITFIALILGVLAVLFVVLVGGADGDD